MGKRNVLCCILAAAMFLSAFAPTALAAGTGQFVVSDAEGMAGETIEVTVSIENNPGIIAAAMEVYYDTDKLKLVSVENSDLFPESTFSQSYSSYPYYASWTDALATSNVCENGILMTMMFLVLEDCESGDAEIGLKIKSGDIFNWKLEEQPFTTESGTVTISESDRVENENEKLESSGAVYDQFIDLEASGWYRSYVEYMLEEGYMNGMGSTTFAPNGSVTRAQLVTILYRMAGTPDVSGTENPFSDVPAGIWYSNAVTWAAANGIVMGVSAESFAPNNNVTREQLATILYRYAGVDADKNDNLSQFEDQESVSTYAREAMNWAVGIGILNGSGARLMPLASASRVQTAAMLTRFAEKEIVIPVPVDPTIKNN